jgi:hypothetical protein
MNRDDAESATEVDAAVDAKGLIKNMLQLAASRS